MPSQPAASPRHLAGRPVEHLRRGAARRHDLHQRLLPRRAARRRGVGPARRATRRRRTASTASSRRARRSSSSCAGTGNTSSSTCPTTDKRQGEVGPGCMADQLIGQWWAHQLGLGYILPKEMVLVRACAPVFKYNFKSDLTGWQHAPRAFAGAKDKGLIICTWPKGGRPGNVMLYSDEVWTGIEYQVAAHMIYEGHGRGRLRRHQGGARPLRRHPAPAHPAQPVERNRVRRPLRPRDVLVVVAAGPLGLGLRRAAPGAALHPAPCAGELQGPSSPGRRAGAACASRGKAPAQRNELSVREGRLAVAEITLSVTLAPRNVAVDCGRKTIHATFTHHAGAVVISLSRPVLVNAGQTLAVRLA